MLGTTASLPLFILAAGLIGQGDKSILARLTSAVHACETSPENGGTLQQAICYRDEFARQDANLNAEWHRVLARLPPPRLTSLRRVERAWVVEREKDCRGEASDYINSTAAYMYNLCRVKATIRRVMWLGRHR